MRNDPIVAEVHRIRKELAARFNFDTHATFADTRDRQASLGTRLVSLVDPAKSTVEADHVRPSGSAATPSANEAPAA